jgi:hypothetical protein
MPNINTVARIAIECVPLDEVLSEKKVCNLLKLDCEGSEYEILYRSSPETIRKIRRVAGEYHEVDSDDKNGMVLCKFLEQNGFKIDSFYALDDTSGIFRARQLNT